MQQVEAESSKGAQGGYAGHAHWQHYVDAYCLIWTLTAGETDVAMQPPATQLGNRLEVVQLRGSAVHKKYDRKVVLMQAAQNLTWIRQKDVTHLIPAGLHLSSLPSM